MKSHQNHNNTTAPSSDTVPLINSIKLLNYCIKQYQTTTYSPTNLLERLIKSGHTPLYRFNKPIYNNWFRHFPQMELANAENSIFLHDYQRHMLADPIGNNLCPIIDGLAMTIDIPNEDIEEVELTLKKRGFKGYKLVRTGPVSFLKCCSEVYENFALYKNKTGSEIVVFWGLSKSLQAARPKQRLLKIYKNPARFTAEDIYNFYSSLKKSYSFDFDQLMPISNVTRIDTALDLHGFHICNLLVDKPNVSTINYRQNELPNGRKVLGTVKLGSPKGCNLTGYDKSFKLFENNPANIPLLRYKNKELLPISRIERKYKPSDGKPISLENLSDTPYFLLDTVLYSPIVLRELTRKERKQVEQTGFLNWLYVLTDDNRRRFILEFVNANTLWVNHEDLFKMQRKQLQTLSNIILSV